MTTDQLAALDAAATPGVWEAHPVRGHAFDEVLARDESGKLSCVMADWQVDYKDAPFIVALVNLWRTGQLVVAPSVEDVADTVFYNLRNGDEEEAMIVATAILKSMGAKTDAG